jgi:hypothetical protein
MGISGRRPQTSSAAAYRAHSSAKAKTRHVHRRAQHTIQFLYSQFRRRESDGLEDFLKCRELKFAGSVLLKLRSSRFLFLSHRT